jgi:hypothetical protein
MVVVHLDRTPYSDVPPDPFWVKLSRNRLDAIDGVAKVEPAKVGFRVLVSIAFLYLALSGAKVDVDVVPSVVGLVPVLPAVVALPRSFTVRAVVTIRAHQRQGCIEFGVQIFVISLLLEKLDDPTLSVEHLERRLKLSLQRGGGVLREAKVFRSPVVPKFVVTTRPDQKQAEFFIVKARSVEQAIHNSCLRLGKDWI